MRTLIIFFLLVNVCAFAQTNEEIGTIKIGNGCEKFLSNDTIFSKVDTPPSFKGGEINLSKFIQKKCIYPKSELENGTEGIPIIQFIVQRNGTLTDIQLYKSSNNILFDKEAVRIAKLFPKWIPGICNDEKVAVVCYLSIRFNRI